MFFSLVLFVIRCTAFRVDWKCRTWN